MLVLSRLRDESIMIGDDIEITVVGIRGDKVRLGITAPTKIALHRKEVYEAIKRENERAAQTAGPHSSPASTGVPSGLPAAFKVPPGASRALARTHTSQLSSGTNDAQATGN